MIEPLLTEEGKKFVDSLKLTTKERKELDKMVRPDRWSGLDYISTSTEALEEHPNCCGAKILYLTDLRSFPQALGAVLAASAGKTSLLSAVATSTQRRQIGWLRRLGWKEEDYVRNPNTGNKIKPLHTTLPHRLAVYK